MKFEVYVVDIATPDYESKQGMQLIHDKGGEVYIKDAKQIGERRLKQRVGFPRFFYMNKHIGNLKSLKKFLATWQPNRLTMKKSRDVPAREVGKDVLRRAWVELRSGIVLTFLDKKYWVAKEHDMQRIIQETQTDRVEYRSDRVDCDNFSIRFAADVNKYGLNTVAIVYDILGKHCYNVVFFEQSDGSIVARAFEPQTDQFVQLGHGLYVGKAGIAVLA